MKRNKPIAISVAVLLFAATLIISALSPKPSQSTAVPQTAAAASKEQTYAKAPDDMRGVWVTYMELSMENESDKSEAAFRKKFEKIAADCQSFGFNTMIVQTRPFCDALYNSKLFPASHILSGTQGESAGYDALKIMCEVCHDHKMKLHAWVNPYRVTASQTPSKLSENNPYMKDKSLGIVTDSGIILDPSNKKARKLITDGVREIVENYPVDGVQYDDYFYPTDIENSDSARYSEYIDSAGIQGAMTLEQWRTANVNLLIAETYIAVHQSSQNAVFGISPQGNLGNNAQLCADVVSWCGIQGYADYICPQIYFSPDNPRLGFSEALSDWTELSYAENVKLYVGLAAYKAGTDADEGTWQNSDTILSDEYNILIENNTVSGFMLYSYASFNEEAAKQELNNLKAAIDQSESTPSQQSPVAAVSLTRLTSPQSELSPPDT